MVSDGSNDASRGPRLAVHYSVDRGVIATASELFEARHYPGVVALVSDALEEEPECVALLLVRARSHIALRRDLDAQADLRDIIRLEPQCSLAYRLLGELAARRDENESAAIFFREALRLDPEDREAADWLMICASARPAAAAHKLPAPVAAAGRFPLARGKTANEGTTRTLSSPARTDQRPGGQPRFARGTRSPEDERVTQPFSGERPTTRFARGSQSQWDQPAPLPPPPTIHAHGSAPKLTPMPELVHERVTIPGPQPVRRPMAQPRAISRGPTPELPGFGEYLVTTGILTRERLRAAQAYQRSMKVQLSTAIVTLGLATPQRIEWAAVAHQSERGRDR